MSSFGIDLGGGQIKVCVWNGNRLSSTGVGAEIVENDRSERTSPARISFKDTVFNICGQRSENVAANIANNIWGFKPVIGSNPPPLSTLCEKLHMDEPERAFYPIRYDGKDVKLDSEVVASLVLQYIYYRCLRDESTTYESFPMELPKLLDQHHKMTIAIPSYYTTSNVRGLEAALYLRNLQNAVFIRENVAVGLDYGFYKAVRGEFPEAGKTILFCDMGAYAMTVTVIHFTNKGMEVLGSCSEMMGGTTIDQLLADLLYTKCNEQFGETIERTERVNRKLCETAEKLKKDFSGKGVKDLNFIIPCLFNDEDGEGTISKEEFEAVCRNGESVLERFYHFVINSIQVICGDRMIDGVETVGGMLRLPQLREELQRAVEHCGYSIDKIGTTLNMEESCARGCALFSNMYWNEQSVACGEQKVTLVDEQELVTMNVCCCGPVEHFSKEQYVIQCNEPLSEGVDHDWHVIVEEGKAFMDLFVKNCEDLYQRQHKRNDLEQICSELRNCIENCKEKPELTKTLKKDRLLVSTVDDLIRIQKLQPVSVYAERISDVSSRLSFYRSTMHISSNRMRVGDTIFRGVWIDGHMTGSFDCYDLANTHLYTAVFQEGVLNGKMTQYFENKRIKSVQHYKEGKLNGPYIGYHENGQIADSCTFRDDQKEGYWQVYYENGQIAKEGVMKDGKNVFVNLYHRNGVIAYQHLYTDKGKLHSSYEFTRNGEIVYWGRMVNGLYSGESLVFYRDEFYAKCTFADGLICANGDIFSKDLIRWSVLDKQMDEKGELDTSVIHWKPLQRGLRDLPQCREVTLSYNGQHHIISTMTYQTQFDLLRKEGDGEVPVKDSEGSIRYMTQDEIRKHTLYDSNIQEAVSKTYTLFGDLKTVVEFNASPVRTMRCTHYYPIGRNEVLLNCPEECRKRAEGELKDRKASGPWKEYYNNGKLRFEGEKEAGKWKEKKCYLNNGKLLEN